MPKRLPYHNELNATPEHIRYSWVAFTTDDNYHYSGLTWGSLSRVHKQHCIGIIYVTDLVEQRVLIFHQPDINELLTLWRAEYYNYAWRLPDDVKKVIDNV